VKKYWPLAFFGVFLLIWACSISWGADLKVIVEAENFLREENGAVTKTAGRIESSGNNCLLGWNNKGHAIEWEVVIPETGQYKIVLRYANGRNWTTLRSLTVDGQVPAKAFERIELLPSGGFAKTENNWQNLTVVDERHEPVLVEMAQGKHQVRMVNLGGIGNDDGATNLDAIGFLGKTVDPNVLGKPGK
jgi:hypothetical protein